MDIKSSNRFIVITHIIQDNLKNNDYYFNNISSNNTKLDSLLNKENYKLDFLKSKKQFDLFKSEYSKLTNEIYFADLLKFIFLLQLFILLLFNVSDFH